MWHPQLRNSAKMKAFQPEMQKLKDEMDAEPNKDPDTVKAFQVKYKALMKKHDVNPFTSVLIPMTQVTHYSLTMRPRLQIVCGDSLTAFHRSQSS